MRPILLLAGTVFAVLPLLAVGCVCPPPQQGRGGHQDEGDRVLEAEAATRRSADTIPAMVALSDAAPVDKVLHEHPHFAMIIRWAAYTDQLDPVKRYIASTASRARCFVLYERVDVMTGYGPRTSPQKFEPKKPGKRWMDDHAHVTVLLIYEDDRGIGYVTNAAHPSLEYGPDVADGYAGVHGGQWNVGQGEREHRERYDAVVKALRKLALPKGTAFRMKYESASADGTQFARMVRYAAGTMETVAAVNMDDVNNPDLAQWDLFRLWYLVYFGPTTKWERVLRLIE